MTIAVLVYHRILEGRADVGRARGAAAGPAGAGPAAGRFHDVPAAAFEAQLDLLAARGARPGAEPGLLRLADGRGVWLNFDDATADHAGAAARLERRGWRGVFLVPAGRLGEPGRLGPAQVAALAARGHVIGSHGLTHERFDRLGPAALDQELVRSRDLLAALGGREVAWLAPPGGLCPHGLQERAAAHGYQRVRGMQWGLAAEPPAGVLPALPVTCRTTPVALSRQLDGQGLARLGRLKALAKVALGEDRWDALRERWR